MSDELLTSHTGTDREGEFVVCCLKANDYAVAMHEPVLRSCVFPFIRKKGREREESLCPFLDHSTLFNQSHGVIEPNETFFQILAE